MCWGRGGGGGGEEAQVCRCRSLHNQCNQITEQTLPSLDLEHIPETKEYRAYEAERVGMERKKFCLGICQIAVITVC